MKKLVKEDLQDLKFDGIIVGVPIKENIKEGQHDDISFIVECNYYTNGKHGYKEPGYGCDNSSFYHIAYNMDCLHNGLWMNATSRFTIEHSFRFDSYDYYKFDSMEEFCTWYLQQKDREIWINDGENKALVHNINARNSINQSKEWIHEKCGTNTPPTSIPERPSIGNKKRSNDKSIDYEYSEEYRNCDDIYEQVNALNIPEKDKIALYKYLRTTRSYINGQVESFNEFLKDYFKEEVQKLKTTEGLVNIIGEDGKPKYVRLMSTNEAGNKINPCCSTRRNKYKDIVELIYSMIEINNKKQEVRALQCNPVYEETYIKQKEKLEEMQLNFDKWLDEEV